MDANVDLVTLEEVKNAVFNCRSKLDNSISLIKNEWHFMDEYFDGEEANRFREQTQNACDSIACVIGTLTQMERFINNLDERVLDYDRTQYQG